MTAMIKRDLTKMSRDQIAAAFTPDRLGVGVEVFDHNLYHRKTLVAAGGVTSLTFFNESVGNNNVTRHTTNMEENGKLPDNKDFLVEAIELVPVSKAATEADRLADLELLGDVGITSILYNKRKYIEDGPCREFISSTKLIGVDGNTGESPKQYYLLTNPILIPGGKNFQGVIDFDGGSPALSADVEINFRLLGQEIVDNGK